MVLGFLLNLFFFISGVSKELSLLLTSGVMAASYFISNHFISLSDIGVWVYIEWAIYDLLTISSILFCHYFFSKKFCVAAYYVFFGLFINTFLYFLIFSDFYFMKTTERWWFWSFYTIAVNVVDVVMVAVLIVNKDFMFLVKGNGILKKFLAKL